jgi:hypothetical protein
MYTNIDSNIGINSIKTFLNKIINNIPTDFPIDLFLKALTLVMEKNILSFSNTSWLQLTGTAMGTPAACSYVTITYSQHENTRILTTFGPYLLYYQRYIDDIFGIWLPQTTGNTNAWKRFKTELNNWAPWNGCWKPPPNKQFF